jgi:hypothetical protein
MKQIPLIEDAGIPKLPPRAYLGRRCRLQTSLDRIVDLAVNGSAGYVPELIEAG